MFLCPRQARIEQNVSVAKKNVRRLLLTVHVFLCLIVSSLTPVSGIAQEHLSVDFSTVIQDNFLGVNAVYHGFTYMPESLEQGMTDELRAIEMERVEQSGLHIARTFYRPDWAMGEGVWTTPDWDSAKMQALYAWLADMQKRNVDVALNMGWWFARDVIWNRDQHLPTYPDDMLHYIAWVSESIHQIIEIRKFTNVKYLVMFTEPGGNYGDIPHGKKTWEYYKQVLRAVHKRLLDDGRRQLVKIVGPNSTQAPRWIEKAATELSDVIDIYSSHNYNFKTYQKWYDLAVQVREASKSSGKPFWVDEYGFQDIGLRRTGEYGNIIAQANAAFLNAGAQTSMIWILNDQYYPYPLKHITNGDAFLDGKHSWGLYPWLPEARTVRPAWNAFALLSQYMGGEGTEVFATQGTADLHVAATRHPDGNTSLLVVNGGTGVKKFQLDFSSPVQNTLYKYLYDPQELSSEMAQGVFASGTSHSQIEDRLSARAVVVYTTIKPVDGAVEKRERLVVRSLEGIEGNVAFKKTLSPSSVTSSSPARNVTDGKRLTFWSSKKHSQSEPEYIIVDLGKTLMLTQVDVYPRSDKPTRNGEGFPVDLKLAVSIDQNQWQTVAIRHNQGSPGPSVQSFIFPKIPAKFIRLYAEKLQKSAVDSLYSLQIAEIKAYAN